MEATTGVVRFHSARFGREGLMLECEVGSRHQRDRGWAVGQSRDHFRRGRGFSIAGVTALGQCLVPFSTCPQKRILVKSQG